MRTIPEKQHRKKSEDVVKMKGSQRKKLLEKKKEKIVVAAGEVPVETGAKRRIIREAFSSFAVAAGLGRGKMTASAVLRGAVLGVLSFFLGRTPVMLDTYPLAIALLASSEKGIVYIFIGAVASAFAARTAEGVLFSPYVYIAAYAVTVVIRVAARLFIDAPEGFDIRLLTGRKNESGERARQLVTLLTGLFKENIYLRMATACVSAFLVSLYAMNAGNYRFYDLFSAMFAMVCAPAVTFIFSNIYIRDRDTLGRILYTAALVAMLTAAVFSLRDVYFFGVGASALLAFGASVYLGMKRGILTGALTGLAAGLAFSPLYAPAFVLAAVAGGVLCGSVPVASAVSFCVAMLWGAYIDGFNSLYVLMPALLSASVLVCAADRLEALPIFSESSERESAASVAVATDELEGPRERMERLSVIFGELSSALYDLSDRMRSPGQTEIGALCTHSFERFCVSCPKNDECRLGEYGEFSEMVSKIGEILGRDKRVRAARLPEHIPKKCIRLDDIIAEINTSFAELIRDRISGEKTELLALDYEGISCILADAARDSEAENEIDEALTDSLCRAMADIGMKDITVRGRRRKRIYAGDIGKKAERMGINEIKEAMEATLGVPISEPVFELKNGRVALRAEMAARYRAESGSFVKQGKGESVSGDSTEIFDNKRDNFYALISDGMGSGQSAAFSSEMCGLFMKKMLCGGNRKETALKMLNTLLRSKGEESSATVDLMELDLVHGRASFIKSGAPPSFVRRGDKLYKLRSDTAPIGIMRAVDAKQVHFEIEDGDVMIMLSDGISQSPEECVWLMELLGEKWDPTEGLDSIAERITEKAVENGSTDDASVILVRVSEIKKAI